VWSLSTTQCRTLPLSARRRGVVWSLSTTQCRTLPLSARRRRGVVWSLSTTQCRTLPLALCTCSCSTGRGVKQSIFMTTWQPVVQRTVSWKHHFTSIFYLVAVVKFLLCPLFSFSFAATRHLRKPTASSAPGEVLTKSKSISVSFKPQNRTEQDASNWEM